MLLENPPSSLETRKAQSSPPQLQTLVQLPDQLICHVLPENPSSSLETRKAQSSPPQLQTLVQLPDQLICHVLL